MKNKAYGLTSGTCPLFLLEFDIYFVLFTFLKKPSVWWWFVCFGLLGRIWVESECFWLTWILINGEQEWRQGSSLDWTMLLHYHEQCQNTDGEVGLIMFVSHQERFKNKVRQKVSTTKIENGFGKKSQMQNGVRCGLSKCISISGKKKTPGTFADTQT